MRMNPSMFNGDKTLDDPREFVDEVHKIFVAMGATDTEKAKFDSYQHKNVA